MALTDHRHAVESAEGGDLARADSYARMVRVLPLDHARVAPTQQNPARRLHPIVHVATQIRVVERHGADGGAQHPQSRRILTGGGRQLHPREVRTQLLFGFTEVCGV
ncbi:MAG TPA: hypothetical protein VKA66_07415 [Mycobacterium sp.]|nr:hypothetical protein [Mycobacterium sp.]